MKLIRPADLDSVLDISDHMNLGTWHSSSTAAVSSMKLQGSNVPVVAPPLPPTARKHVSGNIRGMCGICCIYIAYTYLVSALIFASYKGNRISINEASAQSKTRNPGYSANMGWCLTIYYFHCRRNRWCQFLSINCPPKGKFHLQVSVNFVTI